MRSTVSTYEQSFYTPVYELWIRAEWTNNKVLNRLTPILAVQDQTECGNASVLLIDELLGNLQMVRYGKMPILKLAESRSIFEDNMRQALWRIKPGQPKTYGEIALYLNKPGGAQAVGQACARNPLSLIVPCHRIIAAQSLGGYHWGLSTKQKLLEIEAS